MKRIYLDYAASTPVDKRVLEAMQPYFTEKYGNPGSLHAFGQEAIAAVDKSREKVAESIGAKFEEIIFTGSATEANNLALRGFVKSNEVNKIVVSAVEHESVLKTAQDLEEENVEVVVVPVSKDGLVDLEKLKAALDRKTALVSVIYAQNEIGTIEPIAEISKMVKAFNPEILVHTDAVQAFQYLDCDVGKLGVDLMTLSAHKIYGPKGIGALYVNSRLPAMRALITGGGQEFGLRSGTENVPNIVGFAKAVELVSHSRELESKRVGELRDYFWSELKKIHPGAGQNGGEPGLPNILNVHFPDSRAEDLLIKFDKAGIAVSSGSACSARSAEPSHVLQALGLPMEAVKSSIRFSLGRFTSEREIKETLERIIRSII